MARKTRRELNYEEKAKLDQVKIQLCRTIRRSMCRGYAGQGWLAIKLGTSRTCMGRIQRADIKNLSFNQLFRYLVHLEPHFEVLISI